MIRSMTECTAIIAASLAAMFAAAGIIVYIICTVKG